VEPKEHRYLPWRAGEQPDLPQGMCLVKRPVVQLHAGRQQHFLAATGRHGPRPDVPADIEPRVIDPDRGTEPEAGPVEPLTKPRRQVQALLDPGSDRLKGELSRRIEQNAALEDGEGGNIHGQPMPLDAKVADIEWGQPLDDETVSAHVGTGGRGAPSCCLHQSLEVEQLPSLHPEVERVPEDLEHQSEGQAVDRSPRAGDEPSARVIGRLEHERPRHLAGIVAEHQCPVWLGNPDDEAVVCLWRHREDVADLDPLEFRNDPLRARDASIVQAVVAVPASAPTAHLHKPRPDVSRASPDRDGVVPPDLRVGNQLVARQRLRRLVRQRTNWTPRHRVHDQDA
jgi:hypothetical protein